jgi:nucleoside-diphosphate-sugar epimerase
VNVEGVSSLVDALIAGGCRLLVHISTLSVYDDTAGPEFDEDSRLWVDPPNPDGLPYGFTKAESERIIRRAESRGLAAVILRPGLVLSMHPRSRWGPLVFERARTHAAPLIPFPELPHVHVESLADAVVLAARTPTARGRTYNAVDAVGKTAEYLAVVYGARGLPMPTIPEGAPRLRFRADRIRAELGWAPRNRWTEFVGELSQVAVSSGPGSIRL